MAIVSDLREERWHSMDLIAEMLLLNLRAPERRPIEAVQIRPAMVRRFTQLPAVGGLRSVQMMDRIVNRVWDYPRWLRPQGSDFDLFHIIDHSYAHLVTILPPGRSLVMCHDLDAFQGVLPGSHGGSLISRTLGKRLLEGLKAARKIVCGSAATREELLSFNVVPAQRVTVVPNGVHPTCSPWPEASADREAATFLGPFDHHRAELLHVGSTIARKRIDVLLEVFAAVRQRNPTVHLVRVGDTFTPNQQRLVARLGLAGHVTVLPFVERRVLAAIYRRAALLLQPSDREGFGLPVAEAMACGTHVIASDLPALREVGGEAATYCPVGNVDRWIQAVTDLLREWEHNGEGWRIRRAAGTAQARRFNWLEHARHMTDVYRELLVEIAAEGEATPRVFTDAKRRGA
ncbi:MAG: glycosyltransferase family 4 protein [Vicinamibacterales bacterium]